MHGRRKVKTLDDKKREKEIEEKKVVAKYVSLVNDIDHLKGNGVYNVDILDLTEKLLEINPDSYSHWNYRREVIERLDFPVQDEFYYKELNWLGCSLMSWPKCYSLWFHRQWILNRCEVKWEKEFGLCLAMHKLDCRNFHCWNYRRFLVHKSRTPVQSELEMTVGLLELNFSNYSAWHHRSIFLPKLLQTLNRADGLESIKREYDMVNSAFYTEPTDQSAWIYHRWLLDFTKNSFVEYYKEILAHQLKVCNEILDLEGHSKWPMLTLVILSIENGVTLHPIKKILQNLQKIDAMRRNYYADLSKNLTLQ